MKRFEPNIIKRIINISICTYKCPNCRFGNVSNGSCNYCGWEEGDDLEDLADND